MQTLKAPRTSVTPEVILSPSENLLVISGECYPENPLPFFTPITNALRQYLESQKPSAFTAEMKLQYVNSASTKGLRGIIAVLNDAGASGTSINVKWVHDPDDDAIEELGADLVEDFTFVSLERHHM